MVVLREKLASAQHAIWAHWMKYLFGVSWRNDDGSYTIPPEKAERWLTLIDTPYDALTETEKQSDREQADKILLVLKDGH